MLKTYEILGIAQLVVLLFYIFQPSKPISERWKLALPTSKHLFIFNLLATIGAFLINKELQFFCIPVDWAMILLLFVALSMIMEPLLPEKSKIQYIISFFQGVGFLICIYCILFYHGYGLIAILLALIADVIIFLPLYLLAQLIFKLLDIEKARQIGIPTFFCISVVGLPYFWLAIIIRRFIASQKIHKKIFLSACATLLLITACFTIAYKNVYYHKQAILRMDMKVIEAVKSNFFTNYMLEKAIGFALVYHTEICIYDGWRPPMHEPFLVVAQYFVDSGGSLGESLDAKIMLYKQLYPNVPVQKKCSCASEESSRYFNDSIFKQ